MDLFENEMKEHMGKTKTYPEFLIMSSETWKNETICSSKSVNVASSSHITIVCASSSSKSCDNVIVNSADGVPSIAELNIGL